MKAKLLLIANIIGIVLVLFIIVAGKISYLLFVRNLSESMSGFSPIGSIGGADGPTAIFVSGSFNLDATALLLLLPLLLVGILLIFNVVFLYYSTIRVSRL